LVGRGGIRRERDERAGRDRAPRGWKKVGLRVERARRGLLFPPVPSFLAEEGGREGRKLEYLGCRRRFFSTSEAAS
jgi:hypothetical protein